jgi:hypothetical protein
MRRKKHHHTNSLLFHIFIFLVAFSLFTSTTVRAYDDHSSFLLRILKNMYSILFDVPVKMKPGGADKRGLSTSNSSAGDSTTITIRDPWDIPPSPPPPTSN